MVHAVNKLIKEILTEEFDENVDLAWFDKKRIIKLELLIKNLERIRSRKNLKDLKLGDLLSYLYPLIRYYKRKMSYKDFLKITHHATAKSINEKIDITISNLRKLTSSVFIEPIITELRELGVKESLIKEALTVPKLHGGINRIKNFIGLSIHNFGKRTLDKETIFKLILLRIAAHCHVEKLDVPLVEQIKKQYESTSKPSSYNQAKYMAEQIKDFTVNLNKLYSNYKKLYLARDGFILYEAQLTMVGNNSDVLYVSRDTLRHYFKILVNELSKSISKCGLSDVKSIIEDLTNSFKLLSNKDDKIRTLFDNLIRYLKPYLSGRTLFVDSSSKSIPVILASICKLYHPQLDFKVYFFSTIYHDRKAGFRIGEKENYLIDMMPDYVGYDSEKSSIIPYITKLLPITLKTGRMKQPQAYMAHLVLQSVLKS